MRHMNWKRWICRCLGHVDGNEYCVRCGAPMSLHVMVRDTFRAYRGEIIDNMYSSKNQFLMKLRENSNADL